MTELRSRGFALGLVLLGGCAAAEPRAPTTRVLHPRDVHVRREHRVTRALDSDPPLVGSTQSGWALGAPAEEATGDAVLGEDEAVRIALAENRALRARMLDVGIAEGALAQARTVPNPALSVELSPERETRVELALAYDITALAITPARARRARASLEAVRFEVAGEVLAVGFEVRTAIYALARDEARLGVAQRSLEAAAATRDAMDALYMVGNVTALDHATVLAAYERGRVAVADVELDVARARERLRVLLGDATALGERSVSPRPIHDDPRVRSERDVEARAIAASLDLRARAAELEAAGHGVVLARREGRIPDIELDVHVLEGRPDDVPGRARFGGGITIEVPIFDRGQGAVREAAGEAARAQRSYEHAERTVLSAARWLLANERNARARVLHMERVVLPAQARVLEETLRQYDAMQVDVFRVLAARREVLDAERAHIDAMHDLRVAVAAIETLLAGRVVGVEARLDARPMTETTEGDH